MPLDKHKFVTWMRDHARRFSSGRCAMYVRMGLQAGGLDMAGHPVDAKDYGPFLLSHGFSEVPAEGYEPEPGDVTVFCGNDHHPWGHIEVFDGAGWLSDFRQLGFVPYRDRSDVPPSAVYRFGGEEKSSS
jgi:hypothetical protein